MFPLLAIGAVLLGAAGAVAAAESSSPSKGERRKPASADEAQRAVSPQSYLVTPVNGDQARAITPMESATRFIV